MTRRFDYSKFRRHTECFRKCLTELTSTREIVAALQKEVERIGSEYSLFVLEHHARRPLKYMPEIILDDLACSQVSIFAAQTRPGELGARTEMTAVVNHHRIRHAHMVN